MLGLKASKPVGSFTGVGALLSALTLLSFFVPVEQSPINPLLFVYMPLLATLTAYWLGGVVLLRKGNARLTEAEAEIAKGLQG